MTIREAIEAVEDFDADYENEPTELSDIEKLLDAAIILVEEVKRQRRVISSLDWMINPDRMGS